MAVFGGIVGADFAISGADDHDGDFLFEGNPCFKHGAFFTEFLPSFGRVFGAFDLELAFAIVSEGGCFEDAGAVEFRHCGGEVFNGFDYPEVGAGDSVLPEEILFAFPILADTDGCRGREKTDFFRDPTHGGEGNVFEFNRGYGGFFAKLEECLGIVERLVDHLVGDLYGGSF